MASSTSFSRSLSTRTHTSQYCAAQKLAAVTGHELCREKQRRRTATRNTQAGWEESRWVVKIPS